MKKAAQKPVAVKAPRKLDIETAIAPDELVVPIKKPATAYLVGYVTALQQIKNLFHGQFRSFGEAADWLNQAEGQQRSELVDAVQGELKAKRLKTEGKEITTSKTPAGPMIIIKSTKLSPEVQEPIAGTDLVEETAAPAANGTAPPARKASIRRRAK